MKMFILDRTRAALSVQDITLKPGTYGGGRYIVTSSLSMGLIVVPSQCGIPNAYVGTLGRIDRAALHLTCNELGIKKFILAGMNFYAEEIDTTVVSELTERNALRPLLWYQGLVPINQYRARSSKQPAFIERFGV